MRKVFEFFAKRHLLANVFVILVLLLGVGTTLRIKREINPEVDFGTLRITTRYPGASAEDVELNVTNKIEDELKNISGVREISSVSMENLSLVIVDLEPDISNKQEVKDEVRNAVDRVTDLPPEVTEAPLVIDLQSNFFPVIEVGLAGDVPYAELRELARFYEKKLNDIEGVGKVESYGLLDREVKVEIESSALQKYMIPLRDVIGAIKQRNVRASAGTFESYTSEKSVITLAEFDDPQEVGDVIVKSSFDGPLIRVKDLAVVREDFEEQNIISRVNGTSAISFLIYKKKSADVIRTVDRVKEFVASQNQELPEGVKVLYSNDYSRYVDKTFNVVRNNGLIGLALVIIVLTVFLNRRISIWVALGIPVAILGTVAVLPLFGFFLDAVTLSAMILVLGIIVDDAIIVSEKIASRRAMGDSPVDAAVNGLDEVFYPVLTTVITTIVAFAPLAFMPGVFGEFVKTPPIVVSAALLISLAEVVIALPSHMVSAFKKSPKSCGGGGCRTWFNPIQEGFEKFLTKLLKFRYLLIFLFVLALGGAVYYSATEMDFILFPSQGADELQVQIELPVGNSLEATSDKVKEVEEIIMGLDETELASFVTRVGVSGSFSTMENQNAASITISLTPATERERTADQIAEALRAKSDSLEGFREVLYRVYSGGPPIGKPIALKIAGDSDSLRRVVADSVVAYLRGVEGVKDIDRDDKLGKQQVEILPDFEKLARYGITVADIARNLRIAYDGEIVTSVRYGDEDVDFRVIMEKSVRQNPELLSTLRIPNMQGRLIPLREIARFKTSPGPSDYRHYEGERITTVEADVNRAVITSVEATNMVKDHFDLDADFPGTRFVITGEAQETMESLMGLLQAFVIAIIAIYFILMVLFNSPTQPFLVMIAIPFGMIGVVLAFALHGYPLSFMGAMGIVGLTGVVVNDSLVLVSQINDIRRNSPDKLIRVVVAEGTAERLRAIVMTTITTVAGLLPLAYGIGGTDFTNAPMALALGYGLLFATPLTLILIPCIYVAGDDIRRILGLRKRHVKK
ncbi:MAG: efflux RND transporter permease subunit [bacterium]